MIRELRLHFLGVLLALSVISFAIYGLVSVRLPGTAAHSSPMAPPPSHELHEADHYLRAAVYTTKGGWSSSLLLLNAEGKAVTARVTLYNRHGAALRVPKITLGAYKSRSWNIADWIGDAEGFEEGSLTVLYNGLSMGLHAQETVTNRERSLSFDVHLEEAMEFMSSTVDGLWWGLNDRTDANVFIANTLATNTTVTPIFYVAGMAHQGEPVVLHAHASQAVDIGKELKELHLSSTSGGISFFYTNGPGAISVVGVISNKHGGFSTTMRFIDHMGGPTTSLHGANIMIGKSGANQGFPTSTRFTPRVILRNNTNQIVQANGRIRYILYDQPNTVELAPVTLAENEVRELDMTPAVNSIGDSAVVDAGIEIEYTGQPGALMAYATSIDQTGSNAFDVPIKDPKGMMFKGGANPWRIDGKNRAVLHVKNVNIPDGEKHQFTVSIYYEGGVYNLPVQSVEAGQTAEIDIRKLRDDQIDDGFGHVIPLNVSSGQLSWYPRAKKGDFIGRLVQYNPSAGTSSSFSCDEPCWCGPDYFSSFLVPGSFDGVPGDVFQVNAYEVDMDCHGWPHGPYHITYANFYTDDPFVADVFYQSSNAYVVLVGGGNANITAQWDGYYTASEDCQQWDWASGWCEVPSCDYASVSATPQTQVNSFSVDISGPRAVQDGSFIDPTFTLTPHGGSVTSYQWSWSAPAGVGNNPLVTFNPSNQATTVTNRHWFAQPDVACPSPPYVSNPPVSSDPYYNSVYTITGQANFAGGRTAQADTTLTVNNYWNPAGTTAPPQISGGPQIGFDSGSNLWVVLNSGSIRRNTPQVTIYVPINSQFYNKTVIHENRHVFQYVSGMNSDLFTVDSLMAQLSPLTDATQAGLNAKIAQAFNDWYTGQLVWVGIRRDAAEQDAHSISDPVAPRYAYQLCQ